MELGDDVADNGAVPVDHFSTAGSSDVGIHTHNHEGITSSSSTIPECACMHTQGDMELDEDHEAESSDWLTVDKKTRKKKGGR